MKERLFRLVKLIAGLATIGLSITLTKQIGSLNPWNVLNDGLSSTTGITIGQANTTVGIIIILIDILAKEKLGIGTVLNALLIGRFTDLFMSINANLGLVPRITELWLQIPLCFVAILINSVGMYLYLSAQLGSGPRDSFMLALTRRLPFSVGTTRMMMEACAFIVGVLLGGEFGVGTFIAVFCGGPTMQRVCKLLGFDVKKTRNESFAETWAFLKDYFGGNKTKA